MGLDVSIYLIVGIPILELGKVEEEVRQVALTNQFGEPTGQHAEIKSVYLSSKNHRYLIGSNETNIDSFRKGRMDFFFDSLPDYNDWVHRGDYEDQTLEGTIIGKFIKPIKKYPEDYSRLQQFSAANPEQIQEKITEVSDFLSNHFDYDGSIFVIAQASYSY